MEFRRRLLVASVLAGVAFGCYALARYHTEWIVTHIVENALLQKLPPDSDKEAFRSRFRSAFGATRDGKRRLEWLLGLSQYLEKRQVLEAGEIDRLLGDPANP